MFSPTEFSGQALMHSQEQSKSMVMGYRLVAFQIIRDMQAGHKLVGYSNRPQPGQFLHFIQHAKNVAHCCA